MGSDFLVAERLEGRGRGARANEVAIREAQWERLGREQDFEGDGPFAVSAASVDLALVRVEGRWLAVSGLCPHQGALLGEGELEGKTLVCRNHGWRFDVTTGERQGHEAGAKHCLGRFAVKEEGGWLWADLGALQSASKGASDRGALRTYDDLPGPPQWPIVGNALQVDISAAHLQWERWAERYGGVFRYRFGSLRVIAMTDPALVNQVFGARPETFRRFTAVEEVFRELGIHGTFSAEGEPWRPLRRLSMQALAQRTIKTAYPMLAEIARSLHRRWEAAADEGRELDLADEMMRFTVDVTTSLAFSHNVGTIESDDDPLQRDLSLVLPALNRRLFALLPYWRWFRLPRDRALDRALSRVRRWVDHTIDEARARLDADPSRRDNPQNFIEAMLTAKDERGEPFSAEAIYGNAITILLAGEDTTANTLAWAVHELLDAPEAVAELRCELDERLGDAPLPAEIGAALDLPYASAVADEAMRMRPVAPYMVFEANHDTVVGDLEIPRGRFILTLMRPPMMDPQRVVEPDVFRPSRWLDERFVESIRDARAHIPFGSGPRICPGRSLALLETRMVLATLYKNFEIERIGERDEVRERSSFTMIPVGLRARLHRRQR